LIVAAWAVPGAGDLVVGPVILVGGGALIGFIVDNPGNEAALLTGTLIPGALVLALEPHHGCLGILGPILLLNVATAIGLMLLGLILGMIAGRATGIAPPGFGPLRALLGGAALVAVAAWAGFAARLASGSIC
jgi:hypothetical protein